MSILRRIHNVARARLLSDGGRLRHYADVAASTVKDSSDLPLITVVVPVHNEERFIAECLESVARQSYENIECVVVDDGSTDGSAAIAAERIHDDARFRVITHDTRTGLAAARNAGLAAARGDFITFLDADDFLIQHTLWHRLRAVHRHQRADVAGAYCAIHVAGEEVRLADMFLAPLRYRGHLEVKDLVSCQGECPFSAHAPLLRTGIVRKLGGFSEMMQHGAEDWDLWLRLMRHGYCFVPSPHIGAVYRQKARSMVREMPAEHCRAARTLVDAAFSAAPPSSLRSAAPYFLPEPLGRYTAQIAKAKRSIQFAAMAQALGNTAACAEIVSEIDLASPALLRRHVNVEGLTHYGIRRALALEPKDYDKARSQYQETARDVIAKVRARVTELGAARFSTAGEGPIDVLFLPHNAYHVTEMSHVAVCLRDLGFTCSFLCIDDVYRDEGARAAVQRLQLPYVDYIDEALDYLRPRVLFVMNDWGGIAAQVVTQANAKGVVTCGFVEGVQDYEDTHLTFWNSRRARRPYRRVGHVLLVGEYDRKFFPSAKVSVVGSPRIELLTHEAPTFPASPRVVINSNFTYGVHTKSQRAWIASAVEACRSVGVDYCISQHPQDRADLSLYPIAKEGLYDLLRGSTLLISRFSGAMLEAMALDKPVIYHNPHGEAVDTFQDAMGAYPITKSTAALVSALRDLLPRAREIHPRESAFFQHHVRRRTDDSAAQRIAQAVRSAMTAASPPPAGQTPSSP